MKPKTKKLSRPKQLTKRCKACGLYRSPWEGNKIKKGENPYPMHDCGGIHSDWGPVSDKDAREIYWETYGN
jgi:hypothetical protein